MAEMLIVIAIIAVLGGVAALAYTRTQRNLAQLECETTAKEIFIAAQNHLTLAKSQNYLGAGTANYGEDGTQASDKGKVYYFVVNGGSAGGADYNVMFNQMLPFGAIDETVRVGGSYIIRYQPDTAMVLDVFFCKRATERYGHNMTDSDYKTLMDGYSGNENLSARREFGSAVVGWFGGEEAVESGGNLAAPTVEVINAERLLVKVTDPNINSKEENIKSLNPMLKLLISNETRTAECAITLTNVNGESVIPLVVPLDGQSRLYERSGDTTTPGPITYTIALDDITKSNMHFADFVSSSFSDSASLNVIWKDAEKKILPGENIYIRAVAYSNKALSNVAYSGEWLTNSLFAELREETVEGSTTATTHALIDNIRHLENLSTAISGFNNKDNEGNALFDSARQTDDLDWKAFDMSIKPEDTETSLTVQIYDSSNRDATASKTGTFLPVNTRKVGSEDDAPEYYLTYDGGGHSISNIAVEIADNAGLFGTLDLKNDNVISNLKLLDFNISSTDAGNAGALVGTLNVAGSATSANITNVVAYNTLPDATVTVKAKNGSTGGLIGVMSGAIVEKSAAALVVESKSTDGSAGGLIGSTSGGKVSGCYSGGHTINDTVTGAVKYSDSAFNVTAATAAGGLIGNAGDTGIEYCYATCSTSGVTAGGLAGISTGTITNSYCTGLVKGTTAQGAFAGSLGKEPTGCGYFEIINEIKDDTTGDITYMGAVGGSSSIAITPFDATANAYNDFVGKPDEWGKAAPYNNKLIDYYHDKAKDDETKVARYTLQTVAKLGAVVQAEVKDAETGDITTPADFVAVHYGDWPVPEIFVLNESKK